MGYSLIHWSLDTLDHKKKNEPDGSNYVMNKISTSISGIKAIKGPIILQHDTNEITHMVLPNAIDLIQKSKHQIVSMYRCLNG